MTKVIQSLNHRSQHQRHSGNLYQPIAAVFRVMQRGLDATVRLHILMHLRGYEGPCVLISEGLTLTVSALRAQVCAVSHLILLQQQKQNRIDTLQCAHQALNIQIHTNLDINKKVE